MNPSTSNPTCPTLSLLYFTVEDSSYGVELTHLVEVARLSENLILTPQHVRALKAILMLREQPIPLIDLREKIQRYPKKYIPQTRALVLQVGNRKLGVIVDKVHGVIRCPKNVQQNLPEDHPCINLPFVNGTCTYEETPLTLIDPTQLITEQEWKALDKVYQSVA